MTRYKAHFDVIRRLIDAGVEEELATKFFAEVASVSSELAADTKHALYPDLKFLGARTADGKTITAAAKAELLAKASAGEEVQLDVDIIGFRQMRGVANRNFMRMEDRRGTLRAVARSGTGMPFLANHDHADIDQRLGTITASKAEFTDEGEAVFVMTLSVTTPRGVEGILRGTIDRFSIGWHATGPVNCSLCGTPVFSECYHLPGRDVENEDGDVATCEWIFTSADTIEVSAVNVPAVLGTGIEDVRASLARATKLPVRPAKKETGMNHEQLCALLGLPASTSEDELKAVLAKQGADSARVKELEASTAKLKADAEVRFAQEQAIAIERRLQDLRTEGKLTAKCDALEASLRRMAEADFATFEAYCDTMPVIVPVAVQTKETATDGTAAAGVIGEADIAAVAAANPHLKGVMSALNLTNEDVAKYGPKRPMGEALMERDAYKEGN